MKNNDFRLNNIDVKSKNFDVSINKTIKQTYLLLSICLFVCFIAACLGLLVNYRINFILFIAGFYFLNYLMEKNKNNYLGIMYLMIFVSFIGFSPRLFFLWQLDNVHGHDMHHQRSFCFLQRHRN